MIIKLLSFIKLLFFRTKYFPFSLVVAQFVNKVSFFTQQRHNLKWIKVITEKSYARRSQIIHEFLDRKYLALAKDMQKRPQKNRIVDKEPIPSKIWIMWWQGVQQAPQLVQATVESIRSSFKNYQVTIITEENFEDYLVVPNAIKEKLSNKNISLTQFADYYRFNLLKRYGGVWLDATVFASSTTQFTSNFWSIKSNSSQVDFSNNPAKGRWSAFAIGSIPEGPLVSFMAEAWTDYWLTEDTVIDYFLVDYLIEFAYCNISSVRAEIDDVPVNNPDIFKLQSDLGKTVDIERELEKISSNSLHKLSYKNHPKMVDNFGKLTIFGQLVAASGKFDAN